MRELETTFVVQPEISDEGAQALFDRLDGIFQRHGATRLLFDDQGKRKLAYEIKRFQKGRYVTVNYFDTGKVVPEIERALRLDEAILRFLTVRVADGIENVEERKVAAVEEEKARKQRAAERAAREAEDARAREAAEAEERARMQTEGLAAAAAAAAAAATADDDDADADADDEDADTEDEES